MYRTVKKNYFTGRSDTINWVFKILDSCEDRKVNSHLIGICGIGGMGKSALLEELSRKHDYSFLVDFKEFNDFYSRFETLVREINRKGIPTEISNRLLDIRTRLVKGIEPHRPENKRWIKDLIDWIPTLNQFAKVAVAVYTAGTKLNELIDKHYRGVGVWLRNQLGDDFGKNFLKIITENPGFAIQLFLEGLTHDLKNTVTTQDLPFLIMFDSLDSIDETILFTTKIGDSQINLNECEIWHVFLTKVNGGLGIVAARDLPILAPVLNIERQDREILQLEHGTCFEILIKRNIPERFQRIFVESCHGSPFVLHAFCDIYERGEMDIDDLEDFRNFALSEVYEKTWRYLIEELRYLSPLASRLALIPFFNREVAKVIHSSLDSQTWKDFIGLSCVGTRGSYFVMHDVAREIAIGIMEDTEIVQKMFLDLFDVFQKREQPIYLALAISAKAVYSEEQAIESLRFILKKFRINHRYEKIIDIIEHSEFRSEWYRSIQNGMLAQSYLDIGIVGQSQSLFEKALDIYKDEQVNENDARLRHMAIILNNYSLLCRRIGLLKEAEEYLLDAININERFSSSYPTLCQESKAGNYNNLGNLYRQLGRYPESLEMLEESLNLFENLPIQDNEFVSYNMIGILNSLGLSHGILRNKEEGEACFRKALDITNMLPENLSTIYAPLKGTVLHNFGLHQYIYGRYEESISLFEESLKIRQNLDDTHPLHICNSLTADSLSGLGISYHKLALKTGNTTMFSTSEDFLKRSITLIEGLDTEVFAFYEVSLAIKLNALGFLYTDMKKCSEALEVHLRALQIRKYLTKKEGDIHDSAIAESLNNIAISLHCLRRWEDAESYLLEALVLRKRLIVISRLTHIVQTAMIYANLGISYQGMKFCKKAEKHFIDGIKLFHEAATKISPIHQNDVMKALGLLYKMYIDCSNLTRDKAKQKVDAIAKDLQRI